MGLKGSYFVWRPKIENHSNLKKSLEAVGALFEAAWGRLRPLEAIRCHLIQNLYIFSPKATILFSTYQHWPQTKIWGWFWGCFEAIWGRFVLVEWVLNIKLSSLWVGWSFCASVIMSIFLRPKWRLKWGYWRSLEVNCAYFVAKVKFNSLKIWKLI